MIEYEKICAKVREIVLQTAQMIKNERQNFSALHNVEIKGHSNFVTHIDKLSEQMLVTKLSALIPEAGFIAEEGTSTKKGEIFNWVIDPIDGTTNFIHGLPPHAISVALMENEEVVIGVVLEISGGEIFYAWKNSQAFCNEKVIQVTNFSEHQQALIATGFPYYDMGKLETYMATMREIMAKTSGLRRLGSAAIDLCYVACGRFEAFWEYGLHPWDVAAGALIIERAGGKVCDFNGNNKYLFNGEIIATNTNYFNNFYEIVHRHMGT
ncbi:MAG TPA: inositol monophosphatase family protein [Prolixibacteraceae bacterium]|nr:inositol monophosphatase family protein [Prolixibacteraceae bacterium]HPR59941.1 inositol monophosphatase family protein [Prolixibacteraceae bacterium]